MEQDFCFVFVPGVLGRFFDVSVFFFFCTVIADSSLLSAGSEPGTVPFFQLTEIFRSNVLVQGEKLNIVRIRKITMQHGEESADWSLFPSKGSGDFAGRED